MEKTETFTYPASQKIVSIGVYIFGFTILLVVFAITLTGVVIERESFSAREVIAVVATLATILILMFGIIATSLTSPDIIVKRDCFRLKTLLYRSRWIYWEEVTFIRNPPLISVFAEVRGIGVNDLNPLYSLVGLIQGLGGRAFLILDRIDRYEQLMQTFEEHRPDLFL